jgi:vacuolar protein sorting-associated protein 26
VDIDITFAGEESRKHVDVKVDKEHRESMPLYLDGESVKGKVS